MRKKPKEKLKAKIAEGWNRRREVIKEKQKENNAACKKWKEVNH